jgi:hypothetical protein
MADLAEDLRALRLDLERRVGSRDVVQRHLAALQADAASRADKALLAKQAGEILQAAIEARRQELRDRVEILVTRGLRAIFGRADMEFFFHAHVRGGVVGIFPALRSKFRDREIEVGIVEGHGGGVADAISFLLRVVVLSLATPRLAPVLFLDEPFRHVSLEYLRGCATLLRELNKSAGIQFVLVTHKPDLLDAADVIYRTSVDNGATVFSIEHDLRDDVFHQRAAGVARRPAGGEEAASLADPAGTPGTPNPLAGAEPVDSPTDDALSRRQIRGETFGVKRSKSMLRRQKRDRKRAERGEDLEVTQDGGAA